MLCYPPNTHTPTPNGSQYLTLIPSPGGWSAPPQNRSQHFILTTSDIRRIAVQAQTAIGEGQEININYVPFIQVPFDKDSRSDYENKHQCFY